MPISSRNAVILSGLQDATLGKRSECDSAPRQCSADSANNCETASGTARLVFTCNLLLGNTKESRLVGGAEEDAADEDVAAVSVEHEDAEEDAADEDAAPVRGADEDVVDEDGAPVMVADEEAGVDEHGAPLSTAARLCLFFFPFRAFLLLFWGCGFGTGIAGANVCVPNTTMQYCHGTMPWKFMAYKVCASLDAQIAEPKMHKARQQPQLTNFPEH